MRYLKQKMYPLKKLYFSLFLYPRDEIPQNVQYDRYWSDTKGKVAGLFNAWKQERAEMVVSILRKEKNISVADLGCGDAGILAYLRDHLSIKKAIGIDVSDAILAHVRQMGIEARKIDVSTPEGEIEIPRTDYILLFEVLEHMMNAERLLSVSYERANRGVFLSFPNSGYIVYRIRLMFGKMPLQWRVHPGEHLRFWTLADARWWIKALGYKNYKIIPYKGIPILNKLLPGMFAAGIFIFIRK